VQGSKKDVTAELVAYNPCRVKQKRFHAWGKKAQRKSLAPQEVQSTFTSIMTSNLPYLLFENIE